MREHLSLYMKSTKTERKSTRERKDGHGGCAGLGNVVTLRRKWQEAFLMIQASECTCPGVRGRQRGFRGCEESQTGVTSLVGKKRGTVHKTVEERREVKKSGGLVQGRKDAACRHGCRFAESRVGVRRAVVAISNPRAAHASGDVLTSAEVIVGAMRM